MRHILLLMWLVAAAALLTGCPRPPAAPSGDAAAARAQEAIASRGVGTDASPEPKTPTPEPEFDDQELGDEYAVDLSYVPSGDQAVAAAILESLFDGAAGMADFQDHLEGTWIPIDQANEMSPDEMPGDAVIYKRVEQDAYLEVLFGPPFSEFFIAAHLGARSDGGWDVIEIVPYDPYMG